MKGGGGGVGVGMERNKIEIAIPNKNPGHIYSTAMIIHKGNYIIHAFMNTHTLSLQEIAAFHQSTDSEAADGATLYKEIKKQQHHR